jgi:hypothetical protein
MRDESAKDMREKMLAPLRYTADDRMPPIIGITSVTVPPGYVLCLDGDPNGDGKINNFDILRIRGCMGFRVPRSIGDWCLCSDVNHDGVVNVFDILVLRGTMP